MIRKLLFVFLIVLPTITYSQVNLTIESVDTVLLSDEGYNVPRAVSTNLIFRNNKLVPTLSDGFTLQCGDDTYNEGNAGNLDGAVIHGNYLFSGNGSGSHGMMLGYSVNYDVKYNLVHGVPVGVVVEGDTGDIYTGGGFCYNILKHNDSNGMIIAGTDSFRVYNNTFYSSREYDRIKAFLRIITNPSGEQDTRHTIIKNNIFYAELNRGTFYFDSASLATLDCDYNIYWVEAGNNEPTFYNETKNETYTFAQWQALGQDEHSVVIDPAFIDTANLIPSVKLDYGVDLGEDYQYGLTTTSDWVVGEYPDTTIQSSAWQMGAIIQPYEADYYIAPWGSDDSTGTFAAPWASFDHAFDQVSSGDTVYVRGGVYYITSRQDGNPIGTKTSPVCFFNYPDEEPILDATTMSTMAPVFYMGENTEYVIFRGITVRNVLQKEANDTQASGFVFYKSKHITLDRCIAHDIGFRGFYFYAPDTIYVYNCDSYNIVDSLSATPGNAGDGFIMTGTSDSDTTDYALFRGCRSWRVSDDGWDVHSNGYIELDSCWVVYGGGYEDYNYGNGFKLNLTISIDRDMISRKVTNCISAYSKNGFNTNDGVNAIPMQIYNNTAIYNGLFSETGYGYRIASSTSDEADELKRVFKNNLAYGNVDGPVVAYGSYTHSNNSWDSGITVTSGDFNGPIDSTTLVTELLASRQTGGYLPYFDNLELSNASELIDAGVDVGLPFIGNAPDIGAFEYIQQLFSSPIRFSPSGSPIFRGGKVVTK